MELFVPSFSPEQFFDLENYEHKALFTNCTFVWQALSNITPYLESYKLGTHNATKQELAYLINPETITIGQGTIIEPGAYIKGPCIIGKNCTIRHSAYIRGHAIIGDNCIVGHTTEMKHSILLNHALAAHFAYIGDTILGNHTNLGAGTKCANLRLQGDPVIVRHGDESISTGLRKFGAIIGDHCQIGCNVVLNPGTLLGKYTQSHPSLNFGGFIPEKSTVRAQSKPIVIH